MPYQLPQDEASKLARQEFKKTDQQFLEHEIESVKMYDHDGTPYAELAFDGSMRFEVGPIDFEPRAGQKARLYGKGFGYSVRGVDIDGREIHYMTTDEEKAKHQSWVDDERKKKEEAWEANKDAIEKRIAALPQVFQARIARFRRKNANFNVEYLPYELFVCEQAVAFATTLKTKENMAKFHDLPYEEQKKMVPELDEGHSGNTFGCACLLASYYLQKPELVKFQHGALAPLVGSDEFGSSLDEEDKKELETLGVGIAVPA